MSAAAVVTLEGAGLHGGRASRLRLVRTLDDRPLVLTRGAASARVDELVVVETVRSTTVARRDGDLRVRTVEHLFAALAAARVRRGIRVEIDGDEVPIADGGARVFADLVGRLEPPSSPPSIAVARHATLTLGESRYTFEPSSEIEVEVEIAFDDARLAPDAGWRGDRADFITRIAPARTFAFERDLDELVQRGLAAHVPRDSAVLVTPTEILSSGPPFRSDEPARHKLLDLIGDLYLYGGPPRGRILARRPGHAATHAAVRQAFDAGILTPTVDRDSSLEA